MKEDCDFQEGTRQKIKWRNSIPNPLILHILLDKEEIYNSNLFYRL